MRSHLACAVLCGAIALSACVTPKYQYLEVATNPPGAEIYLDGERVGVTPTRLRIDRLGHHKLFLKKEGYRAELFVLEHHRADDGLDYITPPDIGARLLKADGGGGQRDLEIELEPQKK